MKVAECQQFGPVSGLKIVEKDSPVPKPNEILITVKAAGVNFADTILVAGNYGRVDLPVVPGLEAAGVVAACGADVRGFAAGDRVLAKPMRGTFAEEIAVDAKYVHKIPDWLDFVTAASIPIVYLTAIGALDWSAKMQPGETLLVLGAAGGVGLAGIEVGKAMGATVIAGASTPEKLALCKAHGADVLLNYSEEDMRARLKEITGGKGVDVVLDLVGGDIAAAALRGMGWGGRILIVGWASGEPLQISANYLWVRQISAMGFTVGYFPRENMERGLADLYRWIEEGRAKPLVSQTFPLADASAALQVLVDRAVTGKVVLTMDGAA